MTRPTMTDCADAWWHLFNRGIAKRAVFETARDVERFLALLGAACRAGDLEVHAYSILTTHYHLLARSPRGDVSAAMQRVVNAYVRWFNRTRKRDGPLFRGRFGRRRIHDGTHWLTVLRYIDLNAPRAGLCELPSDHPHGSARAYRTDGGPGWLRRDVVEAAVGDAAADGRFRPEDYDGFAAAADAAVNAHLVERMMKNPSLPAPRFADLARAASPRQASWAAWKAALADGTATGAAFLSPDETERAARAAARHLGRGASRPELARDLLVALLHGAAGLDRREVAQRTGVKYTTAFLAIERHAARMAADRVYEEVVARAVRAAVRRSLPMPAGVFSLPVGVAGAAARPIVLGSGS